MSEGIKVLKSNMTAAEIKKLPAGTLLRVKYENTREAHLVNISGKLVFDLPKHVRDDDEYGFGIKFDLGVDYTINPKQYEVIDHAPIPAPANETYDFQYKWEGGKYNCSALKYTGDLHPFYFVSLDAYANGGVIEEISEGNLALKYWPKNEDKKWQIILSELQKQITEREAKK